MKKIIFLLVITLIGLSIIGSSFFRVVKNNNGDFSILISENKKLFLKKVTRKLKNFIYDEATKHNPKGDLLPDQIDDKIIQKIKEKVN